MREITYREAIKEALKEEMTKDARVIVFGEDITDWGGSFAITAGLSKKFIEGRIRNTPISEAIIAGLAAGSAMVGMRPVAEIMFNDFLLLAGDQIVNQIAKLRYMTGGQVELPVVIRTAMGGGNSQAAHHSQSLIGMFTNVPGLKIVCPSTPYDAKGILKSAIKDNNPVMVFEHIMLYNIKGEVPEQEYYLPLGKADIKRNGKDITVVAISEMVKKSLSAATRMEKEGIDIEVIDPISLVPLDIETIIESVKKTGKLIVAYNGPIYNGAGTEIVARVVEQAFDYLDSPIYRVAEKMSPIPFSPVLEKDIFPQEEDIISVVKKII
ncbi:MAG: alpha-ketoacid dehydrogenase subunit beta [Actinobacteria bacterium]|nr:alpha-ketoacid dehydrogenase subunit beta [Actinomycetota bacterium]